MKNRFIAFLICMLAVITLVAAQILALLVGKLAVTIGFPSIAEPIIDALLYPVLTYCGLKLVVGKTLRSSLKSFRIGNPSFKWYWVITAILLPLSVIAFFYLTGGTWTILQTSINKRAIAAAFGVLYYSLAAGIVEEMVFRGVIMGTLERVLHPTAAILIPSVLFGAVHVIGAELSFVSVIQLIIAGTLVGIMFSLIEYQSGSFWNNAIVHAFWNMSTIGICHIGFEADENSLYTLVIDTKSILLSGGDFGVESSVISIIGYVTVSAVALCLIRKSRKARLIDGTSVP